MGKATALMWTLALGSGLLPRAGLAYDEEVHTFLVRAGVEDPALAEAAAPVPAEAAAAIRRAVDAWARTSTDAAIREAWVRRYPAPEAFDAWAEKELLLLSHVSDVSGIDGAAPAGVKTLRDALELGARQPDDDWRNRERYAFDAHREALKDATGALVPADPAILNMGKLGALSSQAHAHYGLAAVTFSEDPEVLKKDPRRFAVASGYPPGPILTLAAEMSEIHLELALLAALSDAPSPTLAWLHTGQAFHYLQDVTNQIHTVQVGIYDFFVDATIAQLLMAARTGGGYLAPLRSMPSIGIDILTNHHVLSEHLAKKRVLDALAGRTTPEGARLAEAPKAEDDALRAALDAALAKEGGDEAWRGAFGLAITRAVIEASSFEGAEVYAAVRTIADPRFRKEGVLFDEKHDDPDLCLVPRGTLDAAAYGRFFDLQERAFRRAGTAMRRWIALEKAALARAAEDPAEKERLRSAVIARLVKRQLRMLGEAEARRADYLARPPVATSAEVKMPAMLAGEVLALVLGALAVRWALRRRRAR